MKRRIENAAIMVFMAALLAFCLNSFATEAAAAGNATLRIHLPRQVTVEESSLTLGSIGIIQGADELAQKAGDIALGKIALPGQQIVIDKPTILSRLACSGIPASQVTITGAEQTTVKKQSRVIAGSDLLEMALVFLKANKPHESICQFTPVKMPHDFILPESAAESKIHPVLARTAANSATVRLMMVENGKEKLIEEVMFRLKYNCQQVKAVTDIPAGGVVTTENVKIEQGFADMPQPQNWKPPYGLVAARRLAAGSIITDRMIAAEKSAIVVKRNQNVLIRIENAGLLITAAGKALQEAHAGQCIKVLNTDSRREIFAKVNQDGTVEPVF